MFKVSPILVLLFSIATGLPVSNGQLHAATVQLLDDECAALKSRIDLIDRARSSISAACYSIENDSASQTVLSHLRAAARRGVRVRLVVDGYFNSIPRGTQRHLAEEGVEIREYHRPHLLESDSFLCRLHDKLLVVDGEALILGGRNIGDAYFGEAGRRNYVDRDVIVSGSVAQHAARYFDVLWDCRCVKPVRCRKIVPSIVPGHPWRSVCGICPGPDHIFASSAARTLDRCSADSQPACGQAIQAEWPPVIVEEQSLCFLHSGRPADTRGHEISDEIEKLLAGACRRVVIETPYFVLWDRIEPVFNDLRKRGVSVCILTNSIDSTDNLIVNAELTNQKRRLTEMGIELFEYHGPGILHAKSMIIDDTAVIGSYNLNPRSDYYDTETALVIHSHEVVNQLLESVAMHLSLSRPAVPHRELIHQLIPPERAAPHKYFTIQVLRLISPLIRRHL